MAQPPKITIDTARLTKAIDTVKQGGDTYAAIAELESSSDPVDVAQHYSQLLRELYFQEKNVPLMVMFGRAGIGYALSQAKRIEANDPQTAESLRGIAKTISYNLSVNCWPGWGDEGVTITPSDLVAGYDAALLNLRLAGELKRDAEVVGNAHWAIGAHHLAAGRHADAIAAFDKSAAEFAKADKPDFERMAKGYAALSSTLAPNAAPAAGKKYDATLGDLKSLKTEDAKFFAEQIETAAAVFSNP